MIHRWSDISIQNAPPYPASAPGNRPRVISLLWKIVLAMLIAGVLPILLLSYMSSSSYRAANDQVVSAAEAALDNKSAQSLKARANDAAHRLSQFLESSVIDLKALATIPHGSANYLAFYEAHNGELWMRVSTAASPQDVRQTVPLYREIAYIDRDGWEQIRVVDGKLLPGSEMRYVANPANTTYRSENYFDLTRKLTAGDVYVSHLTAWHTAFPQLQPAGTVILGEADSAAYARYQGVIRFATPLYDSDDNFDGIVMLSLDHRHIMEYIIHIVPDLDNPETAYSNYKSGNYAFMFDDEGYTIAHPIPSRIRGLDLNGQIVSPITSDMNVEEQTRHPFFMPTSLPLYKDIYADVMMKKSDVRFVTNLGGTSRATIYAPINFKYGDYRYSGIFGGIVIGANTNDFHKAAAAVGNVIETQGRNVQLELTIISLLTILIVVVLAAMISRSIIHPLLSLNAVVQQLEKDRFLDTYTLDIILDSRLGDEVTQLAWAFKHMAEQEAEYRTELITANLELKELSANLESRVTERTQALAIIAVISRQLSTILNEQELMDSVVEQLCTTLNYYQVSIFLYDERRQNLFVASSGGEAGKKMIDTKYTLALGEGIIGRAAHKKHSLLSKNVQDDPQWRYNPLLPETRCKAAIPILLSGKLLGVIDIQHKKVGGLKPEDVDLVESIASHVAIAMQNARLFGQAKLRLQMEHLAHERAEKAVAAREQFFSNITHEIRTPLATIATTANLLTSPDWQRKFVKLDEIVVDSLRRIERNSRHLLILINANLDRAQLESGNFIPWPSKFDLRDEIRDAIEFATGAIGDSPLTVNVGHHRTLTIRWAMPDPIEVFADPQRVRQVLINLVANATKFTDDGGHIELFIAPEKAMDGKICLAIRDDGVGIAPDQLKEIFTPFKQGDSAQRSHDGRGTGLGLSISRTMMEKQGGSLWAESDGVGKGATFYVTFPAGAILWHTQRTNESSWSRIRTMSQK